MKHFSVLLVDDDKKNILDLAKKKFPDGGPIRVVRANTESAANAKVKERYFHLALVDPRLNPLRGDIFDGVDVLKKLKTIRPSCERIILTQIDRANASGAVEIVAQLDPLDEIAQGIVTKIAGRFLEVIKQKAMRWLPHLREVESDTSLSRPVEVQGTEMVVELLQSRFRERNLSPEAAITEDEIDFLVSRLFGQGQSWAQIQNGIGIERVRLSPLSDQGFSVAVVVKGQCLSNKGVPGIECVLKFAPRTQVQQELARYSQYVRYRLDVHHRVELLGSELADNFGVLCYNFAGVTSLTKQFLAETSDFFGTLGRMFDQQNWYKEKHKVRLAEHFKQPVYKLDPEDAKKKVQGFVEDLTNRFEGSDRGNQVSVCGISLRHPRITLDDVLVKRVFHDETPGCVVHGDLHCDNVLVDKHGVPMLIDYFTVNPGPRAIDFATLEASVRLSSLRRLNSSGAIVEDRQTDRVLIPQVLKLGGDEEVAWAAVWQRKVAAPKGQKFWVRASIGIGKKARKNFMDPPRLTEMEYAATCLLWALRWFRIPELKDRERARLLVWIDWLVRVLNKT